MWHHSRLLHQHDSRSPWHGRSRNKRVYLRGFPIANMITFLDYIIYMTYDLHGQWDYRNQWADPGCLAGNCLRSHVNLTETVNPLSMITKAGVPSNKVIVGVSSYGRSFRMTTPGCTGPMCTYTGPESGATPGWCTKTAGYISNAEIKEISSKQGNVKTWFDDESHSDMMVFDDVQWVAYMKDSTKNTRAVLYQYFYAMGGTSDWAVDLQAFVPNNERGGIFGRSTAVKRNASPVKKDGRWFRWH